MKSTHIYHFDDCILRINEMIIKIKDSSNSASYYIEKQDYEYCEQLWAEAKLRNLKLTAPK